MYLLAIVQVLIFSVALPSQAAPKTCSDESEKLFASLCFAPNPFPDVDLSYAVGKQPADGWHAVIGNDVARLHLAEGLHGKLLSFSDNFDNSCFRVKLDHGEATGEAPDGKFYGYSNLTSSWNCTFSFDNFGVLLCDFAYQNISIYHENFHIYTSFTDNKNIQVAIMCYPNGQVGWMAAAVTNVLSEEEKKTITDHITSIGFSNDNTVVMYDDEQCTNT